MGKIIEIIGLLALSGTKFLFAPCTLILAKYNFWETILVSTIGGWLGVLVFYFMGLALIKLYYRLFPPKRKAKLFTKKNKFIVKVKRNFGMIGLAIITPAVISIPIGTIVAARYFGHDKKTIPYLLASVIIWSVTLTTLSNWICTFI